MTATEAGSSTSSPSPDTSGAQWEIAHGPHRAVIVEVGGGLRSYAVDGRDVVDGYEADQMCTGGRGQVLMPWPNRVKDGRYHFEGRAHQLPLTEPDRGNAIHGLVRWDRWTAELREADRLDVGYDLYPQPGYPFRLRLGIQYRLAADGLHVTTTARNVGSQRCPFGSGAHPYLTVGTTVVDDALLLVPASTVLPGDERGLPTGAQPVDGTPLDFRRRRPIGATQIDDCYTDLGRGADGMTRVELGPSDAGASVELWMDAAYTHLMVFTGDTVPDVARRSLAVEPMTCPPDAFRTGSGLVTLEPAQTWVGRWGLRPHHADASAAKS
jgi:aldose 1-epimerase